MWHGMYDAYTYHSICGCGRRLWILRLLLVWGMIGVHAGEILGQVGRHLQVIWAETWGSFGKFSGYISKSLGILLGALGDRFGETLDQHVLQVVVRNCSVSLVCTSLDISSVFAAFRTSLSIHMLAMSCSCTACPVHCGLFMSGSSI